VRGRARDYPSRPGEQGLIAMIVLRFISFVLIVIGLMLLGADVMTSLEKGEVTVRSLAQFWATVDKASLDAFKTWLEHTAPAPLPGWIEGSLNIYSWAPFGVLGVIMAFLFSRHPSDEA
jgi:hypothetical protein